MRFESGFNHTDSQRLPMRGWNGSMIDSHHVERVPVVPRGQGMGGVNSGAPDERTVERHAAGQVSG